jgi:uncharacterized protein YecT (DUF1311 family)
MKKFLLFLMLISSSVLAEDMSPAESCIAGDSGVGSVECLKKIFKALNQELDQLNQAVFSSLEERNRKDTITVIHYDYALLAFKRSVLDFKLYRESGCNTFTYYSGGVASGYQQQLYKCLISQTEIHNQFLKKILELK